MFGQSEISYTLASLISSGSSWENSTSDLTIASAFHFHSLCISDECFSQLNMLVQEVYLGLNSLQGKKRKYVKTWKLFWIFSIELYCCSIFKDFSCNGRSYRKTLEVLWTRPTLVLMFRSKQYFKDLLYYKKTKLRSSFFQVLESSVQGLSPKT